MQKVVVASREMLLGFIRTQSFISRPASTVDHLIRHGIVIDERDGNLRVKRPARNLDSLTGAMPRNWHDLLHGEARPL